MGEPQFMGSDINERLWPITDITYDKNLHSLRNRCTVSINGDEVEGQLFVKPEDGLVVFRQLEQQQ